MLGCWAMFVIPVYRVLNFLGFKQNLAVCLLIFFLGLMPNHAVYRYRCVLGSAAHQVCSVQGRILVDTMCCLLGV